MSTTTPRRTVRRRKKRYPPIVYILGVVLIAGLTVLMWFALRSGYETYVKSTYELEHYDIVEKACEDFDVSVPLVYGIMRTESGFDEYALSSVDAKGLMQVTEVALEWIQLRSDEFDEVTYDDLYDPTINIRCGVFLLKLLSEQFDSEQAVIASYNAGNGKVESWLEDSAYSSDGITLDTIPYEETRNYVKRVQTSKEIYQYYYGLEGDQ